MANEFIIRNGFQSRGDSQITGSLDVTGGITGSYTGSFTGDGSGLSNLPTSYGPFGISDASGSYTYYSDFSSSMAAVQSGQTIEMFADVTDTSGETISVKDNITINLNGHTYTYDTGSTVNAFSIPNGYTCYVFNGVMRLSNSTGNLFNMNSNSTLRGDAILTSNAASGYIVSGLASTTIINISGFTVIAESSKSGVYIGNGSNADDLQIFSDTGVALWVNDSAQARNCNVRATNPALYAVKVKGGLFYSMIYSGGATAGAAVNLQSGNSTSQPLGIYNCDIKSLTGHALSIDTPMDIEDSTITTYGIGKNAIYPAVSAVAGFTDVHRCILRSVNGACIDQRLRWFSFTDCYLYSGAGSCITNTFNNPTFDRIRLRDCYLEVAHNSNASHGVILSDNPDHEIFDCHFSLANSGSIALKVQGTGTTASFGDNTFEGADQPIDANLHQGLVKVTDNFGNLDTRYTGSYNYDFTSATAVSASIFSGSFTGDGSGLTGIVSSSYAVTASYALNGGGGSDTNFANTDLTFTADRNHDSNGFDFYVTADSGAFNSAYIGYGFTPTMGGVTTGSYLAVGDSYISITDEIGLKTINLVADGTYSIGISSTQIELNSLGGQDVRIVGALNDILFADASTTRIGINKNTPNSTLDINGDTLISGSLTASGSVHKFDGNVVTNDILQVTNTDSNISAAGTFTPSGGNRAALLLDGTLAVTLADGTSGGILYIYCSAEIAPGTTTITPTNAQGFTSLAFNAIGDTATLMWMGSDWYLLSSHNVTVS